MENVTENSETDTELDLDDLPSNDPVFAGDALGGFELTLPPTPMQTAKAKKQFHDWTVATAGAESPVGR